MGILDFFRKKKIKELEAEPEKITFKGIKPYLDKKQEELKEKEKQVFVSIKQKVNSFIIEINPKIKILEEIDVESKKVEDRAKIIVQESLNKYLNYVVIFKKELKESKKENLEKFVKDVNKIFSDFEKYSYNFYEKATYLIGQELADVKQEIVELSDYFSKVFRDNGKVIDSLNKISYVRLKLKEIDDIDGAIDKINFGIKSLDEETKNNRVQEAEILREIEMIKKSDDYADFLKKKEEIKFAESKLDKKILDLKEVIDFKKLSRVFHSDDMKMGIVKEYKENFRSAFEKNYGENILGLIEDGEVKNNIVEKIEGIKETKSEIEKARQMVSVDKLKESKGELEKLRLVINDLIIKKEKQRKVGDKLSDEKGEMIYSIENEVQKLL